MFQISAVLLSYTSRRGVQWIVLGGGAIYALVVLLMVVDPPGEANLRGMAINFVGFPAALVGYLLASQAKWQFVDPRARLLPGYARAHLLVLAAGGIAGLVLLPIVSALAASANGLGMIACSLVIGTSMGWGIHAPGAAPWIVGMAAFYSLIVEDGRRFWLARELSQETAAFHVAAAAASLAMGAYWLFRLARLTEENDDYVIPVQAQTGSATRLERSQASRYMGRMIDRNQWWSSPVDRWHDRLMTARQRTGDRRKLLRYGFTPTPIELNIVLMGLMMGVVSIMTSRNEASGSMSWGMVIPFLSIGSFMAGQMLAMRRSRMAGELLLPFSREEYVTGVLRAVGYATFKCTVGLGAIACGIWALTGDPLPEWPVLCAIVIVGLSAQVYLFGIGIWSAQFSSALGRLAAVLLGLFPAMIGGGVAGLMLRRGNLEGLMAAAALIGAAGTAIAVYAKRVWLRLELG